MKTLYIPVKEKSNIRGLWKDKNKVYFDNLITREYFSEKYAFLMAKRKLFIEKNQEAIFYTEKNQAFIEDKNGKIETLSNRIIIQINKIKPSFIKLLLNNFNGLTIFKIDNHYKIELWTR